MKRDEYYSVEQIKDNIYRITSLEHVYTELLIGNKKAMLTHSMNRWGTIRKTW